MGAGSILAKTVGGVAAAAAAAIATGVVVERQVVRKRKSAPHTDPYFSLSAPPRTVVADDGVELYAEIDEIAPYSDGEPPGDVPTLLFIHGYALSHHCWYFQREAFRGKYRMAFFDQRSHGDSGMSGREHATVEQLAADLRAVLEQLVPDGPVVLVGHSMGGMAIQAFAEAYPQMYADRVVATALISTAAGGVQAHRILSRHIPDRIGNFAAPRIVATLASAPELVDSARRGSNIGYLAAGAFAFGGEVPGEYVEFVDDMLARTSMSVIAQFFGMFGDLDLTRALETVGTVPTTVICGTKDRLTGIGQSRKLAARIPGARLVEVDGAGHLVIIEDAGLVDAEIEKLVEAVGAKKPSRRSRKAS